MKSIVRIGGKGKSKRVEPIEVMDQEAYHALDVDTRLALIQELIPVGLMHVGKELMAEVRTLAGDKHKRNGCVGCDRWGFQAGSVYVAEQRCRIKVPRVRDTVNRREVPLKSYQKLQKPRGLDELLFKRLLHGLSCRNYRECVEALPGVFSLSPSTVSRRFIRASSRKLKQLMERRLDSYDFVGLVMDGKRFGDDGMIIVVGVTLEGRKIVLGVVQAATENARVCVEFLRQLVERGLRYDKGLLCVIDGAKGLRKAIEEVFGRSGVVQRCQWHKRENVLSYLPENRKELFRKKMEAAYAKETYADAHTALLTLRRELNLVNESAVKSLEEGMEETLTLHRLGLAKQLGRSFRTTNIIESVMAHIGQKTDKVDYWKNSNQKHRWVASALLYAEQRFNRINGYRFLPALREALLKEINQEPKKVVAA